MLEAHLLPWTQDSAYTKTIRPVVAVVVALKLLSRFFEEE